MVLHSSQWGAWLEREREREREAWKGRGDLYMQLELGTRASLCSGVNIRNFNRILLLKKKGKKEKKMKEKKKTEKNYKN